jgi:hypothetical protein
MRYTVYFMELVACVTGFIFWPRIKNTMFKWLPVYLGIIFISEVTVHYLGFVLQRDALAMQMALYWNVPIEFLFFFGLFFLYFRKNACSWLPVAAALLYIVAKAADILWVDYNAFSFTSLSYMAGNVMLLVLIVMFFIKFNLNDDISDTRSQIMFWICIGLMLFYLGTFPFYALWNNLVRHHPLLWQKYWWGTMALNCLMYAFFTFGFIWNKKKL